MPALGIIVNKANPVTALSLAQLARIFTSGAAGGDIAQWSQAGVKGVLGARSVHPVGPLQSDERDSDDPQAGEFLSAEKFGGLNMTHTYEALPHYADVVRRVSEDPAAIGIVALNVPLGDAKVLPLRWTESSAATAPTADNIGAGRYPLDRSVYLYVRVPKGGAPDPEAVAYVQAALAEQGQKAIAAEPSGYIALTAGELAEERGKLER